MSIDARISRVTYEDDGTATFHLEGRDKYHGPGQTSLTVLNPIPGLKFFEGECIWGGASEVMHGNSVLGKREGYCAIRLREKEPPQ